MLIEDGHAISTKSTKVKRRVDLFCVNYEQPRLTPRCLRYLMTLSGPSGSEGDVGGS
jgi:hypothetical protein